MIRVVLMAVLGGTLALAGCRTTELPENGTEGWIAPTPQMAPSSRPPDALLSDPTLQAVVEAQVRRRDSALVVFLGHERPEVRARAAFALGSVQAGAAREALIAALEDPSSGVRADAAFALGQLADSSVAGALLDVLQDDPSLSVQAEALDALGQVGDAPSLVRLAGLDLPSSLEAGRALAIARYGVRGHHSALALDRLLRGLDSADPAVQAAAAYYFGRVTETAPWADRADAVRADARSLEAQPARGLALQNLLRGLARLGDPADVPLFVRALAAAPDWRVRVNAARALSATPGSEGTGALRVALDDPNPHVAGTAATELSARSLTRAEQADVARWIEGHRGRWRVVGPLVGLVADARPDLAGSLLAAYRDSSEAALVPLPERPFAQSAIVGALATVPGDAALRTLEGAAGAGDTRVRAAAVEALKARWASGRDEPDRYYATFASALTSGDVGAAFAAAPVLADSAFEARGSARLLRETYAAMPLPEFLEPRQAIVRAMGAVRDTNAVSFLVDVVLEGHPTLRQVAADALNERLSEGITVEATGEATEPTTPGLDWDRLARWGAFPRVEVTTPRGRVVLRFDALQAPQTVQTILDFVERGLYDGVPFHRVVPNFVVQGGDYVRGDGFGGPEFSIRSEFTRLRYTRGVVGMASAGKDTEGSQWFVTHAMQPHLDGRYTAFGRVVQGMDVIDRLLVGDPILRARVLPPSRR